MAVSWPTAAFPRYLSSSEAKGGPSGGMGGSMRKYWWGDKKFTTFLSSPLIHRPKTTKSTTPTLQKSPLYNCLLVFPTAYCCCKQRLGARLRFGGNCPPLPQRKTAPEWWPRNPRIKICPLLSQLTLGFRAVRYKQVSNDLKPLIQNHEVLLLEYQLPR